MGIERLNGDGDQGDRLDMPVEAQETRHPEFRRDFSTQPLTEAEIERQSKVCRGELRWTGQSWAASEPFPHVQRHDRAERMTREVELPAETRVLPDARDLLPNTNWAELDPRKFSDYSLNPDHAHNGGKAEGWRALGYDVDRPEARLEAAQDLCDIIRDELLVHGKVDQTRDTRFGPAHRILNGFIGPNGRHATLVTCWLVEDRGERSFPKLTTVWVQPHTVKEMER